MPITMQCHCVCRESNANRRYIANDTFIANHPDKIRSFMRAVKQGSDYLLADPAKAWAELKAFVPEFNTLIADKIFERSLVYMSRDLANVPRDWSKVTRCVCPPAQMPVRDPFTLGGTLDQNTATSRRRS